MTVMENRLLSCPEGGDAADEEPARCPRLPLPRGPVSAWLLARLRGPAGGPSALALAPIRVSKGDVDIVEDEDLQLALYVIYELSYRGFADVDEAWEQDPGIHRLRRELERDFEASLRQRVERSGLVDGASCVAEVLDRCDGPSLSAHLLEDGTLDQFRELCVHRSAYQLKEADPHSWAIARLHGARKAALVTIQADEYGNGVPGQSHAELFATVLGSLGLDDRYGAHLDRLPAVTLVTTNLISLFGLQFRLRSALLGHLAGFEMTSVTPMGRYSALADRLGLGDDVRRFYDVHVEADEIHGLLASEVLVGGDLRADGLDPQEVCFGAAALSLVEADLTRHLLRSWAQDESSLRPVPEVASIQ
jgi:hypothetical protein